MSSAATSVIAVAILAGGASRRMGRDKALLPIDGTPCLQRVVRAAAAWSTLVIGRQRPHDWPNDRTRFHPDDHPGEGPLGGLVTTFRHHPGPLLVLPCDLPDIDAACLATLASTWLAKDAAAVVAKLDGQINPLIALYGPSCHAAVIAAFRAGERSPRRLLDRIGAVPITWADARPLADLDTPEDVARRARWQLTRAADRSHLAIPA